MRPPRYTHNSLSSLQATEYAQEQGKFMEYHHAAYEAYWDERADLGDTSVLADLGASVGLDGAELKERVESGHYAQRVVDQYQEALGYGIRGIPTFVFDNLLFTGAQPYEVFQRVMDKALENRAAAPE
jgi:predicted DsbA family dithiol-disulfide isomerase